MKMIFLFCFYLCAVQENSLGLEIVTGADLIGRNLSKFLDDYEDAKIQGQQDSPEAKTIKNEILKRMNDPANKKDIQKYVDPQKIDRFTRGSSVSQFTRAIWDAHKKDPPIKGKGAKILVLDDGGEHGHHVKDTVQQIAPLADIEEAESLSNFYFLESVHAVNYSVVNLNEETNSDAKRILSNRPLLIKSSGNDSCFLNQLCYPHNDLEQLKKIDPSNSGYILVGALGYGNIIAGFSDKPGNDEVAQKNFVWTLGSDVLAKVGLKNIRMSGTSMATPVVTGVAALIAGKYQNLTKGQIKTAILKSAKQEFIIENSEIKIMVHVSKNLSKNPDQSIRFNEKDGYLHVYQPYHDYIWGQGILDIEGALQYAEFLSQGGQNIDQKWSAYLKDKQTKEELSATKIQAVYRGFNVRKPKSHNSGSTSQQIKDWIFVENTRTPADIAHHLFLVYQMNSPVLSKMILEGYVQSGELIHNKENLPLHAVLLKIALDLVENHEFKGFALVKIKQILEKDPINKEYSLLWKRIATTGMRTFFSQIVDTQNTDLIGFISQKYHGIIQKYITEPLEQENSVETLIKLRKESSSRLHFYEQIEKYYSLALQNYSFSWNSNQYIRKLNAWMNLEFPHLEAFDFMVSKAAESFHLGVIIASIARTIDLQHSDIPINSTYNHQELFKTYHNRAGVETNLTSLDWLSTTISNLWGVTTSKNKDQKPTLDHLLKFADLNVQNKDGDTLLHLAIKNNDMNLVTKLINAGCLLNLKNKNNKTQLDLIYEKHWDQILKLERVVSVMNEKLKALLEISDPDIKEIMRYISFGADPNTVGICLQTDYYVAENTPLSVAVQNNDIEAIKILINKGADPTQKYDIPETNALERAIFDQKYSVIKEILDLYKMSELKLQNFLNISLSIEDLVSSFVLIGHGANINTVFHGQSPLYLAAIIKKDKTAVKKLKNHGGLDLTTKQHLGEKMTTVIELLKEKIKKNPSDSDYKEILEILESPEIIKP